MPRGEQIAKPAERDTRTAGFFCSDQEVGPMRRHVRATARAEKVIHLCLASSVAALLLACHEDRVTAPASRENPSFAISDGAHGGGNHFFFLPPTVIPTGPQTFSGTFDATVNATALVCQGTVPCDPSAALAVFTSTGFTGACAGGPLTVDPARQAYIAVWSDPCNLNPTDSYRLYVYAQNAAGARVVLGSADLTIRPPTGCAPAHGPCADPPRVDPQNYSLLVLRRPYVIAFRIEQGALGAVSLRWLRDAGADGSLDFAVWGAGANDVFVVGAGGKILHYNGTRWAAQPSGTASTLAGVWGSSGSDVFAVGRGGRILHYDGTTWTAQPSGTPNIPQNILTGVWGSSGSDVFVVGGGLVTGLFNTILHYDGTTWTEQPSGIANVVLSGVWGSSGSDVFAVGSSGTILHYDGTNWAAQPSGLNTHIGLNGVWGSGGSDVFAVGGGPSPTGDLVSTILHYDGATWTAQVPPPTPGGAGLIGAWGSSGSDVFAVGDGGAIVHYNGTSWATQVSGFDGNLASVWGGSASDVFVVGGGGDRK